MDVCRRPFRCLLYPGLAIILCSNLAAGWDRQECLKKILTRLQEEPSLALDSNSFATDSKGYLLSSLPTVAIKLPACKQTCGDTWSLYPDSGPRLLTWLLPVLLLIANMLYAAIGKERFLMVLHLLGDPIDSILSLLLKVEMWRQCYQDWAGPNNRSKCGAVMTAAIEALVEILHPDFDAGQTGLVLQDLLVYPSVQSDDFDGQVANAASELAECRVSQTIRTWSSIVLYLIQVTAAFVPTLGQAATPSGGRIGTALLLSWLLPVALLSNAVGDFASRRTFLRIMLSFMEGRARKGNRRLSKPSTDLLKALRQVDEMYFKSLAWSGAIYTYRPNKFRPRSVVRGCRIPLLIMVSTIPVILAFVTAFMVLYTKPTYFNCRHFLVISVFAAWLLSPLLTWTIGRTHFRKERQWYLVLAKDALFAVPIMALIIGSSCGLFNSCLCWSGIYTLGIRNAAVYLTNIPQFDRYNAVKYPAIVSTCLALQVGVFLLIRWTYWRRGISLLNWSEKEKETAFLERMTARATTGLRVLDEEQDGRPLSKADDFRRDV